MGCFFFTVNWHFFIFLELFRFSNFKTYMVSFRLFSYIRILRCKNTALCLILMHSLWIFILFTEAHFCLWLSHAAWIAEFNINILQVPQRQSRPKTTITSRLEVPAGPGKANLDYTPTKAIGLEFLFLWEDSIFFPAQFCHFLILLGEAFSPLWLRL